MARSRSRPGLNNRQRSRSKRRDEGRGGGGGSDNKASGGGDHKKDEGGSKSGSSEQEIVAVAIRQLPTEIRERLEKLFEEGLLKEGDLDLRSITVFASLNEGLQARVMNHMEGERIYVANARSKSGFLIATCDKAKTGCLDARGLGAIDPWRTALVAMATPKQKMIDLKPERDWLEQHDEGAVIKIKVNLGSAVEAELGVPSVTVELPLTETSAAIKAKLVAMGVKSIPANKMKLHTESTGYLKECHSFAFYNLADGVVCTLSERKRAGTRFRADHTVMPKRPRTQPPPGAATGPAAGGPTVPAPGLPGLPGLPAFPGLPGAPKGIPGLPGLGLLGAGLPSLPKGPGLALPGGLTFPGTGPGLQLGGGTGPAGLPGTVPAGMPSSLPGGLPGGLSGLAGLMGGMPGMPKPGPPMPFLGLPSGGGGPGAGPPGGGLPGGGLPGGGPCGGCGGPCGGPCGGGFPGMAKGGGMPGGPQPGWRGPPGLALPGPGGGGFMGMSMPGMGGLGPPAMGATAKAGAP